MKSSAPSVQFLALLMLLSLSPLSKDVRPVQSQAVTPVEPSSNDLNVTVISFNDPCDLKAYEELFTERIKIEKVHPVIALTEGKYDPGGLAGEIDFKTKLKELCIEVNQAKVVDIFKYDCRPDLKTNSKGKCYCGSQFATVDFLVAQPPETAQTMKQYFGIKHLNRRVVLEDGKCISGPQGHCTLREFVDMRQKANVEVMECIKGLVCKRTTSNIVTNKRTNETYGLCTDQSRKPLLDVDSAGRRVTGHLVRWVTVVVGAGSFLGSGQRGH